MGNTEEQFDFLPIQTLVFDVFDFQGHSIEREFSTIDRHLWAYRPKQSSQNYNSSPILQFIIEKKRRLSQ